jgi:hypothetical protein
VNGFNRELMSIFRRVSNLFSRSRLDQDIDAELRAHIEMQIDGPDRIITPLILRD